MPVIGQQVATLGLPLRFRQTDRRMTARRRVYHVRKRLVHRCQEVNLDGLLLLARPWRGGLLGRRCRRSSLDLAYPPVLRTGPARFLRLEGPVEVREDVLMRRGGSVVERDGIGRGERVGGVEVTDNDAVVRS